MIDASAPACVTVKPGVIGICAPPCAHALSRWVIRVKIGGDARGDRRATGYAGGVPGAFGGVPAAVAHGKDTGR